MWYRTAREREQKLSELRPHLGGEPVIRVDGLGQRGLRWRLVGLDEAAGQATIETPDRSQRRVEDVRRLTVAPLRGRVLKLRQRAEHALAESWSRLHPELSLRPDRRTPSVAANLIPGVSEELFQRDLSAGAGKELDGKFLSTHSSSALVVNSFAPWKSAPAALSVGSHRELTLVAFEKACPIFGPDHPAWPDLVATRDEALVGVESKLLELLDAKTFEFSDTYDSIGDWRRNGRWYRLIDEMRNARLKFEHLDAAQLVKHALGLMNCYPDRPVTLLYLYWEPVNAGEFPEYGRHRAEVAQFLDLVSGDSGVRFESQSYPELWAAWAERTEPEWVPEHVSRLRARYEIPI